MGIFRRPADKIRPPNSAVLTALLAAADAAAARDDKEAGMAAIQSLYAYFAEDPRPGAAIAALVNLRHTNCAGD